MSTSFTQDNTTFFTLANGLTVMLCEMPDVTSCYASLSVRAGHFYDPEHCQGLAHLLEHMMFMGSRHLPRPNGINDFIEKQGGSVNAWTGTEYANYHFSCPPEAVAQILPAFADTLRKPLIDTGTMENEIQSIDAEFQFKRKDDLRRLYQIHKETCNPAHPFVKFSVGNKHTFGQHAPADLRAQLVDFHNRYYCASNMCLCLVSPLATAKVRQWISDGFDSFTPGERAANQWPALYTRNELGIEIGIRPLQNARRLIVTFALPGLHNEFRTKPLNYISHLLGDEGEGSLLAYLKKQGWATNLIAGSGIEGDNFKDFNVSFQLTARGMNAREQVLLALFAYIRLVIRSVDEPWRYHEKAQLAALAMQYDEVSKPLPLICDYAQYLFTCTPDDILQFRTAMDSFDASVILDALQYFTPQNMRLKVIAPDIETDRICAFYDAHYRVNRLSEDMLARLEQAPDIDALSLPPPNPYLGQNYHLVLPEAGYGVPCRIIDSPGRQFWFAQDQQFHSPKGDIYIAFDIPAFCGAIDAIALKRIWLGAINDYLQAKYYRAEIAGLHYRIYGHQAGLTLHTRGFTNQQTLLAEQLLDAIARYIPSEAAFEHHQNAQRQNLQNALLNKPTNRLFSRLSVLIQRNTQAPVELIDAVSRVSYTDLLSVRDAALSEYYTEGLMHGNWSVAQADEFATRFTTLCPNATGSPLPRSVSRLPAGETLYHRVDCDHDDAAVILYLQAPGADVTHTAMCMLLEQMLAAPFFNVLRTQQQLGYIVGTGYVPHNQHPGMAFYVQSPTHDARSLLEAMTSFLYQQLEEIDFYQHYWSVIQQNLLKQLQEHDLNLSMKSQRLWVSLGIKDDAFNYNAQLAQRISNLSFTDIQAYANQLAQRRLFGELVLHASGKFKPLRVPASQAVDGISAFKQRTPLF
ncbi:insulinase family protein [Alteromonas sp. CYL-A6]|uniref:insulinase family protein n=1 Tax=Alteromonas nitratireducens TaxID=3390813 RepID=UPI0034B0A334